MIIKFCIISMFIIPCTSQGMLRFLGLEHRPTEEITTDIVKAEGIEDEYARHEALRSFYGEWHEAVVAQPKFNDKFALQIEKLYTEHQEHAAQIKKEREELKKEANAREKALKIHREQIKKETLAKEMATKALEKMITKIMHTKNEHESLEEKDTRTISLIPYFEQLKELYVLNFAKFEKYDQQLQGFKKIKERREILERIDFLDAGNDLPGLIHAYAMLLETYDTDRLRSSTQNIIDDLKEELAEKEQISLVTTKRNVQYAALSAQIELIKYNTKKSEFSRKADLASLIEKRARVYKDVDEDKAKAFYKADSAKARQLWLQALAIAPHEHAKQEILKHLQ